MLPLMESHTELQNRLKDSALAFFKAWDEMEKFDNQLGNRKPTTADNVEGFFRFCNLLVRMLVAAREGDAWLKGHQEKVW